MIKLTENSSVNDVLTSIRFFSMRINPISDGDTIKTSIEEVVTTLLQKKNLHETIKLKRICETSQIRYLDNIVDETVMDLSRKILVETKNKRNKPIYSNLFPESPSSIVSHFGIKTQEKYINNILDTLTTNSKYKKFSDTKTKLESALNKLMTASEDREHLYQEENRAMNQLRLEKEKAIQIYNLAYHQLCILYPHDHNFVESMFYSV
jgi:hypothetical protein